MYQRRVVRRGEGEHSSPPPPYPAGKKLIHFVPVVEKEGG